ncbi:MAG: hypothetical protein U0169_14730 [Polyangiaceae bacterium]
MTRTPLPNARVSGAFRRTLTLALAVVAASFVVPATGCADPVDPALYTETNAIVLAQFANSEVTVGGNKVLAGVDGYMEKACGSLDCHGNEGRPLRIYSRRGLRKRGAQNVSNGSPTTDDEIRENYFSVIGLEPEIMSQVVSSDSKGSAPERLLLIRKPLDSKNNELTEPHKGGKIIGTTADESYLCMTGWLTGTSNTNACAVAMSKIP